ncbi:MAG: purine-nucleoside phosphorylase [Lachnospiraceae bacterium]|jgi:purine-nucleoside phosphorylase|nr:purine-nucleoside phosphorylase [Lachnospiraceae bacterium]MEE3460764.1 purine-nucleoside phosphorylase [Lachnospiraceae bacterium]
MNEKLKKAYEIFKSRIDFEPKVAIVLGSGLGGFADEIDVKAELAYKDIDGFPVSTAPSHEGKYIFGYIEQVPVVCMKGRVHYYEGYSMQDVVLPIRLMKLMGADTLFLTNASGGINRNFHAGDFMMITDQISDFVPSPLIGPNDPDLGVRFPDNSHIYTKELQEIIKSTARKLDIDLKQGVYIQFTGPNYETPAEIRMAGILGADAVGMSTAVEAIAASHMKMKVCGISCISNLAAGISLNPLTQEEVEETADRVAPAFRKLVKESVKAMGDI